MHAPAIRGYLVHLYTASALVASVLAILWVLEGRYAAALLALAAAVVIDATDGTLARRYRVARTAPAVDGALLDNLVDFVAYVFAPIVFLLHAGLLAPPSWAYAGLIAIAAAYAFSRTDAKQAAEGFFVGFPSYWNVVALYAYLLALSPAATSAWVVALSLLSFSGLRFLYVSRLRRGRWLHLVLGGAWGAAVLASLLVGPGTVREVLAYASLAYVAFYVAHSLIEDRRARREAAGDRLERRGARH